MWQTVHRPHFEHCLRSDPFLENLSPPWKDGDNVLYKLSCGPIDSRKQDADTLTKPFLTQLRQATRLLTRPTPFFSLGKRHVAIHLRRGDIMVSPDLVSHFRHIGDGFYVSLLDVIRQVLPNAECHIFSTTEGEVAAADFDVYRQKGVHVHLDGDVLDDWAHMAQADLLVTAPSSFSWVAGLLNNRCVVAFPHYPHLPDWIVLNESQGLTNLSTLRQCIADKMLL